MAFLRLLAELRSPVMNQIMMAVSHMGNALVTVIIMSWFYLNVDKYIAACMSFAFYFSSLLAQALKVMIAAPRPWNLDTTFQPVSAAVSTATGHSFPSVHSQSTASLYGAVFYFYKKKNVRIFACVMIVLVCFSRMYLGCHTPLDVAAGAAIGLVISFITCRYFGPMIRKSRHEEVPELFLAVFAVVLIVLAALLYSNGAIDFHNSSDSFKTSGLVLGAAGGFYMEQHLIRFDPAGTLIQKILRFAIAMAGAAAIHLLLRKLSAASLAITCVEFGALGFWITGMTPLIAMRAGLFQLPHEDAA